MPTTSAERAKAWRIAQKEDVARSSTYRANEVKRKRDYRQKMKSKIIEAPSLADKLKLQNCNRQKAFRKKKKYAKSEAVLEPYNSKQTLGKAVHKADRALPNDIRKKRKVIDVLYKKYNVEEEIENSSGDCSYEEDEDVNLVQSFFIRDDISVQAAGRKETVLIGLEKLPVAKRYMVLTVNEAYALFKLNFPSKKFQEASFMQIDQKRYY